MRGRPSVSIELRPHLVADSDLPCHPGNVTDACYIELVLGATIIAVIALVATLLCSRYLMATAPPVSRERVERFARRQSLAVTVAGGALLIRYLDTTRRWRAGGLLLSAVGSVVLSLLIAALGPAKSPGNWSVSVNFITLFAGWFAGAVVAEWFVSSSASGPRRIATVRARALADYLPVPTRVLPAGMWLLLGLADVGALVYVAAENPQGLANIISWTVLDIAVAAMLFAVSRRVLARPQRGTSEDVIETDDAVRSRSLHVLAGSSLTIGGYLFAGTVQALTPYSTTLADGVTSVVQVVCGLLLPIVGYATATGTHAAGGRGGSTVDVRSSP